MLAFIRRLSKSLLGLGLIVLPAVLVWWQHENIIDRIKLFNYDPPAAVKKLAAEDTMTPGAEHIFYINKPKIISSRTEFADYCSVTEQTIVEGCYHGGQSGIFIFSVKDPKLKGIEQVTAAHEMLHGAYERLSSSDKKYVDGLLANFYKNGLTDKRILQTIASYKKTEPSDVVNEMHSVFGTEVSVLPAPLEKYYQRYFSNRAKVAAYSNNYEAQFTSRLSQINAYDAQLASMREQINSRQRSLNALSAKIESDKEHLDSLKASRQYDEYNAAVPGFNNEVNSYNAQVSQLKSLIAQYNQLVITRNALAEDFRSLQNSIDSRLKAKSTQ